MIFQATWKAVLDGTKTETRRICKPGEFLANLVGIPITKEHAQKYHDLWDLNNPYRTSDFGPRVIHCSYRTKWQVGATYAVQPARGQKAIARIRLLEIRQERLQDIDEEGAIAEGCKECTVLEGDWYSNTSPQIMSAREVYEQIWYGLHTKRGERWDDNPLVWCLRFELVEVAE
jgi:hypothetical protein